MVALDAGELDTEQFEIKLREQMERLSSPFHKGIVRKNTELIISNMKMLSEQILKNDINELIMNDSSILKMSLDKEFTRRILFTARNMSKYIHWDNDVVYDLMVDALHAHRIVLGPVGQDWLRRQVAQYQRFLYG